MWHASERMDPSRRATPGLEPSAEWSVARHGEFEALTFPFGAHDAASPHYEGEPFFFGEPACEKDSRAAMSHFRSIIHNPGLGGRDCIQVDSHRYQCDFSRRLRELLAIVGLCALANHENPVSALNSAAFQQ